MTIFQLLADTFIRVWEFLTTRWRYPPAALTNMRLRPGKSDENALMMQFFTWEASHPQMSWWTHFETEVPSLAAMGVTQIWLPPPNKAMRKQGQGYDAYDLWDLGEFYQKGTIATRWGTKEELIRAIATANAHGIDVLIDAVLNHKLGADRPEMFMATPVDSNDRNKEIGPAREIEGWTAFDFYGRADKYSVFKWTYEHFTGLDWDYKTRTNAIYRIDSPKHQGWSKWADTSENGNYDYLLGVDIDHRHPDVRKDLKSWGTWVLQTTGAAGFRFDAIKHMDRRFLLSLIKHVRETLERKDLFSVAEYWSSDVDLIKPYIRVFQGLVTFFDVPLHHNLHNASKAGAAYDLRKVFDNTIVQFRPSDAVTFVDNHECISAVPEYASDDELELRLYWTQQIGQTLESWVGSNFKLQAYALILLYGEGHPCIFYGDLYPNKECYDAAIAAGLKELMHARKRFAYGRRTDYFRGDDKHCVGFVRAGKPLHRRAGCVVLVSNAVAEVAPVTVDGAAAGEASDAASGSKTDDDVSGAHEVTHAGADSDVTVVTATEDVLKEDQQDTKTETSASGAEVATSRPFHSKRMNVGSENANATYRPILESQGTDPGEVVKIDIDGWGEFRCPRGGLQVWIRSDEDTDGDLEDLQGAQN